MKRDENNDAQYLFYKDHASVWLDGKLPEIGKDDVVLFGSFFAINPVLRPVVGALLRSAHEAADRLETISAMSLLQS